ncbi:MAG: YybH family protein [Alphaproteobacteria bacterium]|jgi:ketosteroid isomerase-like protein
MTRDELKASVLDFTDAFNRDDLDGVMAYMAEDAVYDEFNGHRAEGLVAIRAAFAPQFSGQFGEMRFLEEDIVLDADSRSAMISWTCAMKTAERYGGWRGLDLLFFNADGQIIRKETYAKAEKPLMRRLER